ncbi:hypothetical protein C8F04DRAFT_1236636 [Mycena alexandri]|uniref:Uncharacterized protein n=1 Tax=Mycena alexandri TaxID=1745969 RepID=A0AAD6SPH7_9AGAR|nr:hypothetical protein C8F04DRAFT_1236636 [Mycena alexandri]
MTELHACGTTIIPNMEAAGGLQGKFPKTSPVPLNLGTLSLLGSNEELVFKHDIASVMLDSREAEALVVQMMLNEAKAAAAVATASATLAASREAVATAEVKLAATHEKEARHLVNYFTRLYEVARQNINNARLEVIDLEVEQEKAGVKLKDKRHAQEIGRSINVTLD